MKDVLTENVDLPNADPRPADCFALSLVRRVTRSNPLFTADAALLRTLGWRDDAVEELAAVLAINVSFNRAAPFDQLPAVV